MKYAGDDLKLGSTSNTQINSWNTDGPTIAKWTHKPTITDANRQTEILEANIVDE